MADKSDGINYKQITRPILYLGSNESLAAATYVNSKQKYSILIYGERMRTKVRLSLLPHPLQEGQLIRLHWLPSKNGPDNITILGAETIESYDFTDNSYLKKIEGHIEKQAHQPFAFIKGKGIRCFISPSFINGHHLTGNESVSVLAVFNYNKKNAEWAWSCAFLKINN